MPIHNSNRDNRQHPSERIRDNKNYVHGTCPKCGVPYAVVEGKEFDVDNCWMCAHQEHKQNLLAENIVHEVEEFQSKWVSHEEVDLLLEFLANPNEDASHVLNVELSPFDDPRTEAERGFDNDYKDLLATQEDARL